MIRLSYPIIDEECIDEMNDVLRSGMLVQGQYVSRFENDLKKYMNVPYVLANSSGTASLHLALLALGIGKGDVVFLPAFTFPATANVVEVVGAQTCLVDVEIETFNMDTQQLVEAIKNYQGEGTPRAIIIVHEFGAPCNMDEIMEIANKYELFVIEDAACALGTKWGGKQVGTFGDIGCFSWHPRKAITTGEGGAVVTANKELYGRLDLLRNHGIHRTENGDIDFVLPGLNYRLTEFQAVMGGYQLKKFNYMLDTRRKLAELYLDSFKSLKIILPPKKIEGHSWQTFMIRLPEHINRTRVIQEMKDRRIETNLGAQALHMLSYYKGKYGFNKGDYPNAASLYLNGLALPMHSRLSEIDIEYVLINLREIIIDLN